MTKLTEFHRKKKLLSCLIRLHYISEFIWSHTHTHTGIEKEKNIIPPKDSFCFHCNDAHSMISSPRKSNVAEYFPYSVMWSVNRKTKRREKKMAKITKQSYDQPFFQTNSTNETGIRMGMLQFRFFPNFSFWTEIYLFFLASNEIRLHSSVAHLMLTRTKVSFSRSVNCWDLHLIWQNDYFFGEGW